MEGSKSMIANVDDMLAFIQKLKKQIENLNVTRQAALKNMEKMVVEGNRDIVFQDFKGKFEENAKFIDILDELLEKCIAHYDRLAQIVEEHLGRSYQGGGSY